MRLRLYKLNTLSLLSAATTNLKWPNGGSQITMGEKSTKKVEMGVNKYFIRGGENVKGLEDFLKVQFSSFSH